MITGVNRLKFSLLAIIFISIFGYSCSNELDFNSKTIIGGYEGNLIFQWPDEDDTLFEVQCTYDFFSDGTLVFTNIDRMEKDTSKWYLNDSAKKLTIKTDFFFGTSINDITLYTKDELVFEGLTWVNITGSSNEYRRIANLERVR